MWSKGRGEVFLQRTSRQGSSLPERKRSHLRHSVKMKPPDNCPTTKRQSRRDPKRQALPLPGTPPPAHSAKQHHLDGPGLFSSRFHLHPITTALEHFSCADQHHCRDPRPGLHIFILYLFLRDLAPHYHLHLSLVHPLRPALSHLTGPHWPQSSHIQTLLCIWIVLIGDRYNVEFVSSWEEEDGSLWYVHLVFIRRSIPGLIACIEALLLLLDISVIALACCVNVFQEFFCVYYLSMLK